MSSLEEFLEKTQPATFTMILGRPLRYGLEKYRRANGYRTTADACRELLSAGLAQADLS